MRQEEPLHQVAVSAKIQRTSAVPNQGNYPLYRRKRKTIKGLLRTSFGSVSVYDFRSQQIVYSQWRLLRKLGYSEEEYHQVSGHFFQAIRHPDDHYFIDQLIYKIKAARNSQIVKSLFRIRDKTGHYHWIALRCSVLRHYKSGEVRELVGSVTDVSNYKSIKKRLASNMEMISQLSYRNSHELRAPVATALGLLTLIKSELKDNKSEHEMVHILEKTILRMDDVIKEFGHTLDDASGQLSKASDRRSSGI